MTWLLQLLFFGVIEINFLLKIYQATKLSTNPIHIQLFTSKIVMEMKGENET